jgi:trimethylamine:corrinoid methyltransferase-like protein
MDMQEKMEPMSAGINAVSQTSIAVTIMALGQMAAISEMRIAAGMEQQIAATPIGVVTTTITMGFKIDTIHTQVDN